MNLQPGLHLNLLSPSCTTDAVTISPGAERHDDQNEVDGFVPRTDWSALSRQERSVLAPDEPAPLGSSLSFLDLGDDFLDEAHETLLPLLTEEGAGTSDAAGLVRRFHNHVVTALYEDFGLLAETVGAADLVVQRPGLMSTAFNPATKVALGLHIDSHQRLPFGQRQAAMTLCSINIGFAERHLHFVNLTTTALAEMLHRDGHDVPEESANELRHAFLTAFPDYPVLRVTLRPGQAYLCNTQNTIHDGATNSDDLPDVSFLTLNGLPADAVPRRANERVAR